MKTEHFSMRLERKQLAALERIAKKLERPISWVVSKAIDKFVLEHEAKPAKTETEATEPQA